MRLVKLPSVPECLTVLRNTSISQTVDIGLKHINSFFVNRFNWHLFCSYRGNNQPNWRFLFFLHNQIVFWFWLRCWWRYFCLLGLLRKLDAVGKRYFLYPSRYLLLFCFLLLLFRLYLLLQLWSFKRYLLLNSISSCNFDQSLSVVRLD